MLQDWAEKRVHLHASLGSDKGKGDGGERLFC